MASAFLWVISLVILVIAQCVRIGMRWSRKDERRERETAGTPYRPGESVYRPAESVFDYKLEKSSQFKPPKNFK